MDSILDSVKKPLGIAVDYTHFDEDIIMHINSVFSVLTQLGLGPSSGFSIEDNSTEWSEYTTDKVMLSSIKTYVFLKVRLLFDPPSSSIILNAIKENIDELTWRLTVMGEPAH